MPEVGDEIAGRFRLTRRIGTGFLGSVWEAYDSGSDSKSLIKLYPKDERVGATDQYTQYLMEVAEQLGPSPSLEISLPIAAGDTDDHKFVAWRFFDAFKSLDQVIGHEEPLKPIDALRVMAGVARLAARLHDKNVIHADLKPSNILVREGKIADIRLIDFGMVRWLENDHAYLVLGTYRYMHPSLAEVLRDQPTSIMATSRLPARTDNVGAYIDIYSLGVIGLEVLSGRSHIPRPLSEAGLAAMLRSANPWLREVDEGLVYGISNLLVQMLSVRPEVDGISAKAVQAIAESLVTRASDAAARPSSVDRLPAPVSSPVPSGYASTLRRFEELRSGLAYLSVAYVAKEGRLALVENPEHDEEMLNDITELFRNARNRARTSWRVSLGMTVVIFLVLIAMVTTATALAISTGKAWWALIFGGASVSAVIGALIWRPFDRVFKAAALAQQIEMIHVQTIATFRTSTDLEVRIRILRETVAALTALFSHADRS